MMKRHLVVGARVRSIIQAFSRLSNFASLAVCALVVLWACGPEGITINSRKTGVYEIDLQTAIRDQRYDLEYNGPDKYFIRQWRLDIPWAYVYSLRGENGEPSLHKNVLNQTESSSQSILVNGLIDWEREAIEVSAVPGADYDVSIRLSNGRAGKAFWPIDYCWTHEEQDRIVGRAQSVVRDPCDLAGTKFCSASMHFEGWLVRIQMDRQRYIEDPRRVCSVVAKFLNERTVLRESVMLDSIGE